MAVAISHDNSTAPDILKPIEGNMIWSQGPVTYNIVQVSNTDELNEFNSQLPANTTMTQDMPSYWETDLALSLAIVSAYIDLDLEMSTSLDATYLVGQERNDQSLGAANTPDNPGDGFRPAMMFNILTTEHTTQGETGGGSDRFQTIVHEVLHTLGINHPHDEGGGTTLGTGATSDGESMSDPYRWHQTIISYTSAPDAPSHGAQGAFEYGRAVTPMALDIAALQRMYGANTSTHNTATTYSLTDAGSTELDVDGSDGSVSVGRAYYGIWDTGGTDAISYSGSANALINLMPATLTLSPNSKVTDLISQVQNSGVFEYLHSQTQTELTTAAAQAGGFFSSVLTEDGKRIAGGYSIAQGAEIENAEGGSSEDLLIGNDGNNKLTGNGGSDYLFGGDGVDTILGGDGDDFIYGGASESDLRDVVYGGAGNDYVEGGYGNDELRGDAGNDTLAGGFGADTMIGGEGDDQVTGSAWGDVLFGGDGNDFINGGFGYDRVNGGTGADQFFHIGNAGHGSDWIQDYDSSQGDVLFYGAAAVKDDFLIQRATTDGAGTANTQEVFITHKTTGVLLWALVDGDAQSALNVKAGAETFDLLA